MDSSWCNLAMKALLKGGKGQRGVKNYVSLVGKGHSSYLIGGGRWDWQGWSRKGGLCKVCWVFIPESLGEEKTSHPSHPVVRCIRGCGEVFCGYRFIEKKWTFVTAWWVRGSLVGGCWYFYKELGPLKENVRICDWVCNFFEPIGRQLRTWAILVIKCVLRTHEDPLLVALLKLY